MIPSDTSASDSLQWRGRSWRLVVNDEEAVQNDDLVTATTKLLKRCARFEFRKQPLQLVLASAFNEQLTIDRPDIADEDIALSLQWTLKDLVSIPATELIADYYDPPIQPSGTPKINVVAADRRVLMPILDILHAEGFVIEGIANAEMAFTQWPEPEDKFMLLSETQNESNQLHIFGNNQLIMARELNRITPLRQIVISDMDELEALALEIQRSLDFYTGQLRQAPLAELAIATAHPQVAEICAMLGAQLGMQSASLSYPDWCKELSAGDYTDIAVLSGLVWMIAQNTQTERVS